MFSSSGDFILLTPYKGLCPLTPLGAMPADPYYRLAFCAPHSSFSVSMTTTRKVATLSGNALSCCMFDQVHTEMSDCYMQTQTLWFNDHFWRGSGIFDYHFMSDGLSVCECYSCANTGELLVT